MALPANFSEPPSESNGRYFHNLILEFCKKLEESRDIEELQDEMELFLDACKQMDWRHKKTGVYHKDAGEKATQKVWTEFKRYIFNLLQDAEESHPTEVITALNEVRRLAASLEGR